MKKAPLWSMSTTVREAERIIDFLPSAVELEGQEWSRETQEIFQILLIKNRQYLSNENNSQRFNKLNKRQIALLKNKNIEMTFEQAKDIFNTKQYVDPDMRGRNSMAPLVKLGLVFIVDNRVTISDVGHKLASNQISFDEFMLDSMLKMQFSNPCSDNDFKNWNTKPFITTLRLIDTVNKLCVACGKTAKGISAREFGIFALSLKNFNDVNTVANDLLEFRAKFELLPDNQRDGYEKVFTSEYLQSFNNPLKNVKEYTDNMIRYIRLTKYIYIRGKYNHTYIDLEPRRMDEINAILKTDDGSAKQFTPEQWRTYMGTFGAYELPFETVEILSKIAIDIVEDVNAIEKDLYIPATVISIPTDKNNLKVFIEKMRTKRTELQNLEIRRSYRANTERIHEVTSALLDIKNRNRANLAKKFSIELEKWANIALNIINDALRIKPNAPVGDDNEPTYTAPSGVADIECYYESFNAICEVTMLTGRDQWFNEGQPVMRHLRDFEKLYDKLPAYCLFIAPSIHTDTANTFWNAVKYEYEGVKQRIVPITIEQLVKIIKTVQTLLSQERQFTYNMLVDLYDNSVNVGQLPSSRAWLVAVDTNIDIWRNRLIG